MFTLYNVISSDGFIARKDGSEDFIPDNTWVIFLNLCKEYGALVMGRKTYNAIQSYDQRLRDSFESLPIRRLVISSDKYLKLKNGYELVSSPEDVLILVPEALVSSGPILNNYLIKSGLVKEIILYEIPISIGEGLKPYDNLLSEKIKIRKLN